DSTAWKVSGSVGALARGAWATASIVVTAPSTTGTVTNTATVSTLGRAADGTNANNSSTATTTVGAAAAADLSITKTGPASVTAGRSFTVPLSVHTGGPPHAPPSPPHH